MKKLFALAMIVMLVVLPMTAFATGIYAHNDTAVPAKGVTLREQEFYTAGSNVKPINAADYLTAEAPIVAPAVEAPVVEAPAATTTVPATGVFAAIAASTALLAMGLATAKKN